MLNFNTDERRWYLLRPVFGGMVEAIQVLDDEAAALHDGMVRIDGEGLKSIN
jgi:hypothetical protein